MHRDIAARNVLVGTRPQTHKFIAKISDFGLAKILDDSGGFVTDAKVSQRQYGCFFFEILSDLNQAVPNHLADESQTC